MLAFKYKVNSYEDEVKEAIDCLKIYNYDFIFKNLIKVGNFND